MHCQQPHPCPIHRGTGLLSHLLLFLLAAMIILGSPAADAAAPDTQKAVQTLESTLYTITHDQDPMEARVSRLEETVFGQSSPDQPIEQRIKRLQETMKAQLEPLTPAASVPPSAPTAMKPVAKAPGESDYPVVSQIEQRVFNKSWPQEPLQTRLARLEKQVFSVEQRGELADRVDNLRLVVLGDTGNTAPTSATAPQVAAAAPAQAGNQHYIPGYFPPRYHPAAIPPQGGQATGYNTFPTGPGQMPPQAYPRQPPAPVAYPPGMHPSQNPQPPRQPVYGQNGAIAGNVPTSGYPPAPYTPPPGVPPTGTQAAYGAPTPDMEQALGEVEQQVFKTSYPTDSFKSRLDRLENHIFHATSPEMQDEERLQRVIAVAAADGSNPTPQSKAKSTFQTLLPIILTILPMLLL